MRNFRLLCLESYCLLPFDSYSPFLRLFPFLRLLMVGFEWYYAECETVRCSFSEATARLFDSVHSRVSKGIADECETFDSCVWKAFAHSDLKATPHLSHC